jgi:membrane-bound serine protease (ClpP class)
MKTQKISARFRFVFLSLVAFCAIPGSFAESGKLRIPVIEIEDSINPGMGAHVSESLQRAKDQAAPFLVIRLNTPGGLLSTTRQIIQDMLNSPIPVVVYVSPRGAHAGSAGALITFAADVAVMAPGTNIGAAHPVAGGGEKMDDTLATKVANDTAAFARSLAKSKNRNTEWAEKAVKTSESISADEALKQNVIDLVAQDLDELATKLPSFVLKAPKNGVTALPAGGYEWDRWDTKIKNRIVSFFSDPNLAYMILSLGALCIWIELSHPGLILPGVVGAICVLLSLVSFQLLPISYGALALMLVGLGLLVGELFLPTYGILGTGGVIAFVVGSLFLMDTTDPLFQISLKIILPTATLLVGAIVALAYLVYRSRMLRPRSGVEALVGELAEVKSKVTAKHGKVFVQGELWSAVSEKDAEFPSGSIVEVKSVRNLLLVVAERKAES